MHQATPTSWMMLNREISSWQERALKAEAECDRLRASVESLLPHVVQAAVRNYGDARDCYEAATKALVV